MKQQPQDRVAIYSRKSKFTGKGESIGNQVELCRAHIGGLWGESCAHGALVFEDEGFSGGNLNRPAFQRMMACAQAGQFRAIVVYRLDRISRSIGDFAALIQELDRLGVAFLSIREQFDTDSPMGRAMMYIASVFSQLERETIAERIRDNLRELAKTGRWLGGVTPTGFASESVKTVTLDGKSKKACKLKLIPAEAETVRHIFNLYLETGSLARTEEKLGALPTKTGRRFTRFSIRAILQNPVYLTADEAARDYFLQRQVEVFPDSSAFDGVHGILAYRRTRQEKGKSTVSLPVQEWIISVGQHPGIIPARDWIAVQEMLERNRSGSYHTPRKNEALLTGLLFCRCGGKMYPKASRCSDGSFPRFSYVCKIKERSRRSLCSCPNAGGQALDEAVLAQLATLPEDREEVLRLLSARQADAGHQELSHLTEAQRETRRRLTALVDSLADLGDGPARTHAAARIEELHRTLETLSARIRILEQPPLSIQNLPSLQDCLIQMTAEQRRSALRTVIQTVIWDGQQAYALLPGASVSRAELFATLRCEDSK